MKRELVHEKQVFGKVIATPMHPTTLPTPDDHMRFAPGAESVNGNNGRTHGPSFSDPNPGAYKYACRNRENPFAFIDRDFGPGHVHLTERQTNAL